MRARSDHEHVAVTTPVLAIVGATGSGKNSLAQEIAGKTDSTLLSVDSRKVYRGLDIGTAKPSCEARERFDYAMIDCADPTEAFSAGRFMVEARQIVRERRATGRHVILVGGTGFYLEAFRNGIAALPEIDPEIRAAVLKDAEDDGWRSLHARLATVDPNFAAGVEPTDKTRILRGYETFRQTGRKLSDYMRESRPTPCDWPMVVVFLTHDRDTLYERIEERVNRMIGSGLFDEVQSLIDEGLPAGCPGLQSVGYPESIEFLKGQINENEAIEQIIRNSRRYAKRQLTWFRNRDYVHPVNYQQDVTQRVTDLWRSLGASLGDSESH